MMQQTNPEDFVIATGRMETVRSFIEICAKKLGWQKFSNEPAIIWEGENKSEIGRRSDNNKIVVQVDPRYFRPTEVNELLGDANKAKEKLGWVPKISLEEMINEMIDYDLQEANKEQLLKEKGYTSSSF